MKYLKYYFIALLTLSLMIRLSPGVIDTAQALPPVNMTQESQKNDKLGKVNDAINILTNSVNTFEKAGDNLNQGIALINLSLAYQQLGIWKKAEESINEGVKLLEKFKNSSSSSTAYAQALDVLGGVQLIKGKAEEALYNWQEAAKIYENIGDNKRLIRNQINSAQAMQSLGFYGQAKKTLIKVKKNLDKQSPSELKAKGLRSLGDVLRVIGDVNDESEPQKKEENLKGEEVLKESREVAKELNNRILIAESELSIGNTLFAKRRNLLSFGDEGEKEAKNIVEPILESYRKAVDNGSEVIQIKALLGQLNLFIDINQDHEAQALFPEILSKIRNLKPSRISVYLQVKLAKNFMELKFNKKETQKDKSVSKDTINNPSILEIAKLLSNAIQQAENIEDKRAESHAIGTLAHLYEQIGQYTEAEKLTNKALWAGIQFEDIAYQWEWQLGRLQKKQGKLEDAKKNYEVAYKTLERVRKSLVSISTDLQFSFREDVEPVYREYVDLLLQNNAESNSNNSKYNAKKLQGIDLKKPREVMESLQIAELNNFFRTACIKPIVKIDEVVNQLPDKTAVIYPIILEDRVEIILSLPNKEELRQYSQEGISKKNVEEQVKKLRELLPDVAQDIEKLQKASQQIYDWLISHLERDLKENKVETLVFILDGTLQNIPMGVLYNKQKDKYLIEEYAIALNPGLQLVKPKLIREVELDVLTAGVGKKQTIKEQNFEELKNVEDELNKIQSTIPKGEKLLNEDFTKNNLEKQLRSNSFSVVHLATHGQFSSNLENTYIVAWDELLRSREFDNLLRVNTSRNKQDIELLVLSACKTAKGDKRAALGLAGVAVQAGVRSTIATLWSVDDEISSNFMRHLYEKLKDRKITKAKALQQAQLAIFNENKPYHWAPYVLLGNWL
jgi:CHAT domain-containing protein